MACMLIGIGLMLFGVARQHWQEWSGFAVLATWIVLVLPNRIQVVPRNKPRRATDKLLQMSSPVLFTMLTSSSRRGEQFVDASASEHLTEAAA